jgi:hypothetical protein
MYLTPCNNPRAIRFRPNETILAAVFPGEREPSLEEINHLMGPIMEEIIELGNGKFSISL